MYQLPSPLSILEDPPLHNSLKRMIKSKMVDYWEIKLQADSSQLTSVPFFNPYFMSLTKPHSFWSSSGSNPLIVIVARMISGMYLTDRLQRHWTQHYKEGFCLLPACQPHKCSGTLEHLLIFCPEISYWI